MSIGYNHIRTRVRLYHITCNLRALRSMGSDVWPVVKSDAYGHGLAETAKALASQGAQTMCAGTVGESVDLRQSFRGRIISLLGPLDQPDYTALLEHDIVPYIGQREQLIKLSEAASRADVQAPVALKFNTGMSRLGFDLKEVPALLDDLASMDNIKPVIVSSHLASADEPERFHTLPEQQALFEQALTAVRGAGYEVQASLANSAALIGHPGLRYDGQRPGIALYGANPFAGTGHEGEAVELRPTMDVVSRILQIRDIAPGEHVSYGGTFTAEKDMRIAVIAAGYADNYSRGLSGKGAVCINGHRAPILGRVCMQLCMVDISHIPDAEVGGEVYLLGGTGEGRITVEELAGWWGTITYEVFCLLGMNPREYVSGADFSAG